MLKFEGANSVSMQRHSEIDSIIINIFIQNRFSSSEYGVFQAESNLSAYSFSLTTQEKLKHLNAV